MAAGNDIVPGPHNLGPALAEARRDILRHGGLSVFLFGYHTQSLASFRVHDGRMASAPMSATGGKMTLS